MTLLFPFCAFLLLFWLLLRQPGNDDWRRPFLLASLYWSLFLVAAIESLSLFRSLSVWPMAALWGLLCALLIYLALKTKSDAQPVLPLFSYQSPWTTPERIALGGGALLLTLITIVAFMAPPNSWDAMTYHLPRAFFWIQQGSVDHYPTHNLRQTYMPPFAEYVITLGLLQTGGDRLANLPQLIAWAGTAVAASLLARTIGAGRTGQIVAALFTFTLPTGVLEATGTKNDCVLSYWLVLFAYLGFVWEKRPDNLGNAALAGAALGLALLTKGTAYVVALPFILWFGYRGIKSLGMAILKPVVVVAVVSVAINAGLYARNLAVFGHPLGTMAEEDLHLKPTNDIHTPAALLSNALRGAAIHVGTPFSSLNDLLHTGVELIHDFLLGINLNDRRTTWALDFYIQEYDPLKLHEFVVGSPWHLLALALLTAALVGRLISLPRRGVALLAVTGGALFLTLLFFKWTPQNMRYHLPLFALAAPVVGALVSEVKREKVVAGFVALLIAFALPLALMNRTRPLMPLEGPLRRVMEVVNHYVIVNKYNDAALPLIDREMAYFSGQPFVTYDFMAVIKALNASGCRRIGYRHDAINDPFASWALEYQFMALVGKGEEQPLLWRHVNVDNTTSRLMRNPAFAPCAVLESYVSEEYLAAGKVVSPEKKPDRIVVEGQPFRRTMTLTNIALFAPENGAIEQRQ